MSYDLVLKDSKHNWARGACCSPISATARLTAASTAAAPKPPTLAELNLTPDEKKKLAGVAAIKKASQSGDKHAQRQWKKAPKIIAKLKAKAAKGDPKAQRSLQIMRAAKMFAPGAVLLGKDEILGREFIGKAEHGHLKDHGGLRDSDLWAPISTTTRPPSPGMAGSAKRTPSLACAASIPSTPTSRPSTGDGGAR